MTSKQMFQVMQDRYRAMNPMRNLKTSDDDGEENPEVILAAALGNMKIDKKMREGILAMVSDNGASNKCFICGETGHKSYECGRNKDNDEEQKDRRRFKGKCNHCGRIGHKSERCWSKEENAHLRPPWFKGTTETGNASIDGECVLTNVDVIPKEVVCTTQIETDVQRLMNNCTNLWIADTGASVHCTNSDKGMTACQEVSGEAITVGNGKAVQTLKYGRLPGKFVDKEGKELFKATIDEVAYTPKAAFNLFSLTKMMRKGWTLGGGKDAIWISNGNKTILFDIPILTSRGVLFCANFQRVEELANVANSNNKKVSVERLHQQLGHCGETDTRKAAKELNIELTRGKLKTCEACAKGKAKQKSLPKETNHQVASADQRRIFLDISTIKRSDTQKIVSKGQWRLVVDEITQLKMSGFFDTKNGMVEPTCEMLQQLKADGIVVKYVRMDNAGENLKFEQRANSAAWKLAIKPEYTARNTPQQNHLAELGFATLYRVARKACELATKLDGLLVKEVNGV
eukprot:scaffold2318_cov88-Cylindrotheca_fusiformis.AAC.1